MTLAAWLKFIPVAALLCTLTLAATGEWRGLTGAFFVTPAQAGVQGPRSDWTPAFAGVTGKSRMGGGALWPHPGHVGGFPPFATRATPFLPHV